MTECLRRITVFLHWMTECLHQMSECLCWMVECLRRMAECLPQITECLHWMTECLCRWPPLSKKINAPSFVVYSIHITTINAPSFVVYSIHITTMSHLPMAACINDWIGNALASVRNTVAKVHIYFTFCYSFSTAGFMQENDRVFSDKLNSYEI
jgi:hypothetical protein